MMQPAAAIQRARWHVAALRVQLALVRCRLVLRAYDPGQLRAPAGNPDGGRWTSGDDGGTGLTDDDARLLPVADQGERRYGVLLDEEEARSGHTLREHVGKTDAEMMQRVRRERWQLPFVTTGRRRDGSCASQDSANDFVNRTLEANSSAVDAVAAGNQPEDFLTHRFGYKTGREAYRIRDNDAYLRDTYSVDVFIRHDSSTSRGYRVITAYPRNDGE